MSGSTKGEKYGSLIIRNATLVNGRGTPASGPTDIVIEGDRITEVVSVSPGAASRSGFKRPEGDVEIDAAGMYVLPGFVDMHVHVPFRESQCGPEAPEYAYKLFLAHGVTTIRTCGFGTDEKLVEHRRLSEENGLAAPRIVVMGSTGEITTPDEGREAVHRLHKLGTDGIKMIPRSNVTAEILAAMGEEVRELDMKAGIAVHIPQSSELDAVTASEAVPDYLSLEHTYGIPQAAIPGSQSLPPDYNYSDEVDRFRLSGHVWTEADRYPDNVLWALDTMIENGTVWDPTMAVYEINREYQLPSRWRWLDRYAAPGLLRGWEPNPASHATYHFNWRTADEVAWKQKYRIWMKYLKVFADRGGVVTAGTDCGFMYTLYGFGLVRELELLQEAGFHPIGVVKIATTNATASMGLKDLAGGVQKGFTADIAIVDGNPLDNFKVMYGTGVKMYSEDRTSVVQGGGVRWTIKGGALYDCRTLLNEVEEYVSELKG
ncbi:MAG: amidohydrolase family protein [Candidatus Bathyarchaeota archaeon]|nr:MAG: amidohydrolase family protein [Candidatus Bathyarchaeota archaeon]